MEDVKNCAPHGQPIAYVVPEVMVVQVHVYRKGAHAGQGLGNTQRCRQVMDGRKNESKHVGK